MAIPLIPPGFLPPETNEKANDALVKDGVKSALTLAQEAGFTGNAAKDAVGVMGAESSFNPAARNETPCSKNGDHAIGLMQICTIHAGSLGIPADKAKAEQWLKNPENNMSAAYKLWVRSGGTFKKDWVQAKNNAYLQFRNKRGYETRITVDKNTAGGVAGEVVDKALGPVDEFVGALVNPSTWLRVGKGVVGWNFVVIGSGILAFVLANKAMKTDAGKVAKKVVTKKVVK